jgi:hypothetical protein
MSSFAIISRQHPPLFIVPVTLPEARCSIGMDPNVMLLLLLLLLLYLLLFMWMHCIC